MMKREFEPIDAGGRMHTMTILRSKDICSADSLLESFESPINAVVVGASGGIGAAVLELLDHCPNVQNIMALSRRQMPDGHKIKSASIDLTDENSIEQAAMVAKSAMGDVHLIFVATGVLHESASQPEKTYKNVSPEWISQVFAINATGPMLIAKHFVPMFPRHGKAVFASISAKVGSITDNGLGGWYGYRASKAALNQFTKTLSIEVARKHSEAICLALHPGTVDTLLSAPFQAGVSEARLFTPEYSANRLLQVIDQSDATESGQLVAWDGEVLPY